jgi:phosphomannomutase
MRELTESHATAKVEQLDGMTFRYDDWWFNVRGTEQSPTINLTLEARSRKMVEQRLAELVPIVGRRVTKEFQMGQTAPNPSSSEAVGV